VPALFWKHGAGSDCDADDQVDLSCEKQAAINTLNHFDQFDLKGILLRIDGQVSAFGISAPLTRDMAALQYEKAFRQHQGTCTSISTTPVPVCFLTAIPT
jgi:hypothetical protein